MLSEPDPGDIVLAPKVQHLTILREIRCSIYVGLGLALTTSLTVLSKSSLHGPSEKLLRRSGLGQASKVKMFFQPFCRTCAKLKTALDSRTECLYVVVDSCSLIT